MAPEFQYTFDADPSKPAPQTEKASMPEKDGESVQKIGEKIQKEFQTPEEKALIEAEIKKSLQAKFNKFSKAFQAKYSDAQGQPDYPRIIALFGLDKKINGSSTQPDNSNSTFTFEDSSNTSNIPENPKTVSGSQFISEMSNLGNLNDRNIQKQMEQRIMEEIAKGNIPSWCRPENMKAIEMQGTDGTKALLKVAPNYLAIGNDQDFIRVPITAILAQTLCEKYGWGMPTRTIAHTIYDQADIKLYAQGLVTAPQGSALQREQQNQMQGAEFIKRHNTLINNQLGPEGLARLQKGGVIVAGEKKDDIISKYVIEKGGKRLDFSGFYDKKGRPIQDNPAHESWYRDYASGFRPIAGNVIIINPNGTSETKPYYEALKDPKIGSILNGDEGPIDAAGAYKG